MIKFKNIVKTQNIIRVGPDETLSSALSKLSTSHDAAFVFEDNPLKFLGLINPYYCLINSSLPGNAKVEHCLFHPPKLKTNFPINKVINLMIQSKVHFLPVFDEQDKFTGIISSKAILAAVKNDPRFKIKISDILNRKKRPLITIYEDDTLPTAINLFKEYKISKLVVISRDLKLKGILSYYDLIHFLITPKERSQAGGREGNKVSFYNHRVKNFAKTYVLTLPPSDQLVSALNLILEKHIGSVVIADPQRRPLGIITTRDFFNLLLQPHLGIQFELLGKNLSKQSMQVRDLFSHNLFAWTKKMPNLSKIRLFVKEEKQGGVFKVLLSLFTKKGTSEVFKREGKNLAKLLLDIKTGLQARLGRR